MHIRHAVSVVSLTCLLLLFGFAAGCGDDAAEEVTPPTEIDPEAIEEAIEDLPDVEDVADSESDEDADPAEREAEHDEETEADPDAAGEVEEVEEDLERRHLGAWITRGGQLDGSQFVFMPGGRAQMGNERMMLSGEYTIDHDREMPYLYIRLEVMGRIVESHYFVEYLPDDRLRFHAAEPDPDAPGEHRVQQGGHVLNLVRNE